MKLDEHQRLLSSVVRDAPAVLWAIDLEGKFLLSEGRSLEGLGMAPGELVGKSAFERYADVPELIAALHRALAGDSFSTTVGMGGLTFESRFAPIRDDAGRQTGVIAVSTDITERVRSVREVTRSHEETIRRLALAVEQRSHETRDHIERMSQVCVGLARRLGLSDARCELIRVASPMHDVGKIAIPDEVLLKPAPLELAERATMQRHAEIGHSILGGSPAELLQLAADIAWTHHERFDGQGYPRGLAGSEIPLEGRIAAVGDVFDALTHDRVYRPAIPLDTALEIMTGGRGTQFDPEVLDEFLTTVPGVEAEPAAAE